MADLADDLTTDTDGRLDQAQGVVRSYCGWDISPIRTGDTYKITAPSRVVLLPTIRLLAVTGIEDGVSTVYVEDVDYYWTAAGVLTNVCGYWPRGTVFTFTHGYADVPAEVTGVVQAIAQRAVSNPLSLTETVTGPYTSVYGSRAGSVVLLGLTEGEKATLDAYRITEQ